MTNSLIPIISPYTFYIPPFESVPLDIAINIEPNITKSYIIINNSTSVVRITNTGFITIKDGSLSITIINYPTPSGILKKTNEDDDHRYIIQLGNMGKSLMVNKGDVLGYLIPADRL